jgi:hypothetical protein
MVATTLHCPRGTAVEDNPDAAQCNSPSETHPTHGGNMQTRILTHITATTVLETFGSAFALAAPQRQPLQCYVFRLGAPGGGNCSNADGINDLGRAAGGAYQARHTTEHARLWVGTPPDLGTLGGLNHAATWPNKNNHKGEIAEITDLNPSRKDWSCAFASFPPPEMENAQPKRWPMS